MSLKKEITSGVSNNLAKIAEYFSSFDTVKMGEEKEHFCKNYGVFLDQKTGLFCESIALKNCQARHEVNNCYACSECDYVTKRIFLENNL